MRYVVIVEYRVLPNHREVFFDFGTKRSRGFGSK